jgi:plastocyanin
MQNRAGACLASIALVFMLACGGGDDDGNGTGIDTGDAHGTVLDNLNIAVVGASITITKGTSVRTAMTNSAGEYSFVGLEPGTWSLQASTPNGYTLATGEAGTRSFAVSAGQNTTISAIRFDKLQSVSTGTVTGRVLNNATGVAGASISLSGVSAPQTTNSNGNYAFTDVTPGAKTVTVTLPPGFALVANETAQKSTTVNAGQISTVNWNVQQQATAPTVDVAMTNSQFVPATITVQRGGAVRWTNNDNTSHDAVADNGAFNSGVFSSGSRTVVMTTAGSFPYHCNFHAGMNGTVVVQ